MTHAFDQTLDNIAKVFQLEPEDADTEEEATASLSKFFKGLGDYAEELNKSVTPTDPKDVFEALIIHKLKDHVTSVIMNAILNTLLALSAQTTLMNLEKLKIIREVMQKSRPHITIIVEQQKKLIPTLYNDFLGKMHAINPDNTKNGGSADILRN